MNFKRKRPRLHTHVKIDKRRISGDDPLVRNYLSKSPAWWDILFHHRPHRHETKRLERAVIRDKDPDDTAWPVRHKPHHYFW